MKTRILKYRFDFIVFPDNPIFSENLIKDSKVLFLF